MNGITEGSWNGNVMDGRLEFDRSMNCYGSVDCNGSVNWNWNSNGLYWNVDWNVDGRGASVNGHKSAGLMRGGSVIDAISHTSAILVEDDVATTSGRCSRKKSKEDDGL